MSTYEVTVLSLRDSGRDWNEPCIFKTKATTTEHKAGTTTYANKKTKN